MLRRAIESVLIAGLVAAAAYQIPQLLANRQPDEARILKRGDVLANVNLMSFPEDGAPSAVPLYEVFGDQCGIMIFFLSTCPFCKEMAPAWAEVTSVHTLAGDLPVAWTALSVADTGAMGFVERHRLAYPWYAVRNMQDRLKLGVDAWPKLYLVSPNGKYEGEVTSRDPRVISVPAGTCQKG